MIRVLIADDDTLVLEGLKILIDMEVDMQVVAVASDGEDAFILAKKHRPDIVLMDIRMPKIDGIMGAKMIREHDTRIKVLMLTTFKDDEYINQAIINGAQGYMLKNQPSETIINGIRMVINGANIFGDEIAEKFKTMLPLKKKKIDMQQLDLSEREVEILEYISQGLNNKEIAALLFISDGTVRNYVTTLLNKLELRDRTQLAIFYIRNME